jgi:antitoxin PrlF
MLHSTVTAKGQTTIPGEIRHALNIKPGGRLEYAVEGDRAIIRVYPGTRALRGLLAGDQGRGFSFRQIRNAAAKAVHRRRVRP